jgi:hypothetical protein
MLSEPPDADPHVRWCGGRQGEPGAYPIELETVAARVLARKLQTLPAEKSPLPR